MAVDPMGRGTLDWLTGRESEAHLGLSVWKDISTRGASKLGLLASLRVGLTRRRHCWIAPNCWAVVGDWQGFEASVWHLGTRGLVQRGKRIPGLWP